MHNSSKILGRAERPNVVRGFLVLLGALAVLWGALNLPIFWQDSGVQRMATQIIAGDEFKNETLIQQIPTLDEIEGARICRPAALRSASIVRLRLFERTEFANAQERDEARSKLMAAIRRSLGCLPADAFLWLADYFIGVGGEGLKPEFINALGESYKVGPHEGWIAIKRNRIAFEGFTRLPSDLRLAAITEFVDMVHDSHFYGFAADILVGPAWSQRDEILLELSRLGDAKRAEFEEVLKQRGYVRVPGIGLTGLDSHRFAPPILVPQ